MVSSKTLFATGAALLATISSATATIAKVYSIRDSDTPCGYEPTPGIRKPIDGMTFPYTSDDTDGINIEIIYCSSDYFKTSSINVTVLLSTESYSGMIIGFAEPNSDAAPDGFFGYIFNVTVYPSDFDLTGSQKLSIFEFETGYYNAYNFRVSTITIDLEEVASGYTS